MFMTRMKFLGRGESMANETMEKHCWGILAELKKGQFTRGELGLLLHLFKEIVKVTEKMLAPYRKE